MTAKRRLGSIVAALLAIAASSAATEPQLVGSGVVSTEAPEFGTAINPRTGSIYFNRIEPEIGMHIWVAERTGRSWGSAHRLPFADDRYNDTDPFVTRSGDRLYFASNRPRPGSASANPRPDDDLWYLERTPNGDWSAPIYAGTGINSDANESSASEDRAGNLYFSRRGAQVRQILLTKRRGRGFGPAHEVAIQGPAGVAFGNVAVSADGRTLVLAGGKGGSPQLWVTRRTKGEWSLAQMLDLPPDNMAKFAPYLSSDGRTLYFTGERPVPDAPRGQRDIYETSFGH